MLARSLVLAFVVVSLTALSVVGGEDDAMELARARVQELLESAQRFQELGMHDLAERLEKHAVEIRQRAAARHKRAGKLDRERAERALEGLERGIEALELLGKEDAAHHLMEIAEGLATRLGRRNEDEEHDGHEGREEAQMRRHMKVMGWALDAFREAGKSEWGERLEHALHAHELELEGRTDREAREIMESAPESGAILELLHAAMQLWDEWGHEDKAHAIRDLMSVVRSHMQHERENERRRGHDERRHGDRDEARKQLHIMRIAVDALVEADRDRVAEILERAMHAREMILAGREDAEAREIRDNAPSRGNQVEALMLAHRLLLEWKHEGQAKIVGSLIRAMHPEWQGVGSAARLKRASMGNREAEGLQERIQQLESMLEELEARLRTLKGKR